MSVVSNDDASRSESLLSVSSPGVTSSTSVHREVILPYYGRNYFVPVSEPLRVSAQSKVSRILESIEKPDFLDKVKDSKASWKVLQDDLQKTNRNLESNGVGR